MTKSLYNYKALVTGVYDGDTITVEFDLGFKIKFTEKVRLYGINTPEIRGAERQDGLVSRDKLCEWILNKTIILQTIKDRKGKYGRYLGIVHLQINGKWVNVNQKLVYEGLAVESDY